MVHDQLRRQIIADRLDGIVFDAERWSHEAFETADVELATGWFEIAAIVRAALQLVKSEAC